MLLHSYEYMRLFLFCQGDELRRVRFLVLQTQQGDGMISIQLRCALLLVLMTPEEILPKHERSKEDHPRPGLVDKQERGDHQQAEQHTDDACRTPVGFLHSERKYSHEEKITKSTSQ